MRPIFFHYDNRIVVSLQPDALKGFADIERATGLVPLSDFQLKTLKAVQDLAEKYQLSLDTEAGDLVFVNNYGIVHGREAFKDSSDHQRYVVRLWLRNENLAWNLPSDLQLANYMVFDDDSLLPNWNVAPVERVKFQMYERAMP